MLHGITPSTTTLNTKTDSYASAKAGQVTKPPRHARQKTHIWWCGVFGLFFGFMWQETKPLKGFGLLFNGVVVVSYSPALVGA